MKSQRASSISQLTTLIEHACADCCEQRAGVVFDSLPARVRQACIEDPRIGRLVARSEKQGVATPYSILATEMVRVLKDVHLRLDRF
jgi:hypothetical protein